MVSVLVLVGGVVTAVASYLQIESPRQVLQSYFAALRAADAPRALGYGRPVSGDTRYLTSAVLAAQQRLAPVGVPTVLSEERSGPAAKLTITYSIGSDRPLQEQVVLHRDSRRWRLDTPAPTVRLDIGPAAHRANLAGLAVPTGAVALFPGVVPLDYDTDNLQVRSHSDRVTFTATGILQVTPELTTAGRDAVTTGVKAAMTKCLDEGSSAPPNCPLTPVSQRTVPATLRGEVTDLDLSSDPELVSSDADGLVQIAGTFTVTGSWQTLDGNNQAVRRTGAAAVQMTARAYVTVPAEIAWVRG